MMKRSILRGSRVSNLARTGQTHNSTAWTEEQIKEFPLLGTFKNNWRRRTVSVYEHPDQPTRVVTVGRGQGPYDDTVICSEFRDGYGRQLQFGDWSDYD